MSLVLRCPITFAFTAWTLIAYAAMVAHAQTTHPAFHKTPTLLPAISNEILDRLPPGCTSSWVNLDSPELLAPPSGSQTGTGASIQSTLGMRHAPHTLLTSQAVPTPTVSPLALTSAPDAEGLLPAPTPSPTRPADKEAASMQPSKPKRIGSSATPSTKQADSVDPPSDSDEDDDLLGGGALLDDSLFDQPTPRLEAGASENGSVPQSSQAPSKSAPKSPRTSEEDIAIEAQYPSAQTCAKCHPKHYDEWRMSGHAYANVSPMFQRFEQAMQDLTKGTVGSFCVRCHSPVATQLCLPPAASILDAPRVVREGITCVACHRVKEAVGRTNGDRRIEPGDIHAPIYGASGGEGVRDAISNAKQLKLKLSADQIGPGQAMHQHCGPFEPVSKSDFCASCHQVAVHPGIWLEIVHAQYRSGPAHDKGITCQQCHMGSEPGKATGYEFAHCAVVADKPFGTPRKHSNHIFWGPGYSIAHPGVFPHNPDADRFTPRQWLTFEYRKGWGTTDFEKNVPPGTAFPPAWDTRDDRIDGRKIIDANLLKLMEKRDAATLTLSAGARVDGPTFDHKPVTATALRFTYRVSNLSDGHNMPTGSLGAQPQMWLNVALIDPTGVRIWESGYLDQHGDLADLQSMDVNSHRLNRDSQLFNLQTKFLINNVRGTDREAPVPLNFSLDQLVFLRPGAVPVSVLNHPPLIRMEAHSIPPLDHRMASYTVPAELIRYPGPYRLSVRLRSRPEPPYFMRLVGASPEMIRRLNEGIIDIESDSHTFNVERPEQIAMPKKYLLR